MINYVIHNFLILFIFISITLLALKGYGKSLIKLSKLDYEFCKHFQAIELIFGLIFVGFVGILINFFIPITDFITCIMFVIGLIFFLIFFLKEKEKKINLIHIALIILFSIIFSFYTLANDDFDYHFRTIQNFKEFPITDFVVDRRVNYNSHWLIISSVFYISKFPESLYCITSLLYFSVVLDFYNSFNRNYLNKNYLSATYALLVLLFLVGKMNIYKEYGTDYPGQIIILLIFMIYFERNKLIVNNNDNATFLVLVIMALFALTIKVINVLIFILLLILFLQLKRKIYIFFISILMITPTILWMIQNYFISKCFIWPIVATCFDNINGAIQEMYFIKTHAKSVLDLGYSHITKEGIPSEELAIIVNGFGWVPIWFKSHFPKILETYAVFFVLLIIPTIIFQFKKIKKNNFSSIEINTNLLKLNLKNPYLIFSFVSIFATIIWFVNAPGYRFGISYNLNFLIIVLLPLWQNIIINDSNYFKKTVKILFTIGILFFLYNNISKTQQYIERYGYNWPNIVHGQYIYKK